MATIVELAPMQKLTKATRLVARLGVLRTNSSAATTSRYSSRPRPAMPPLGLAALSPWLRKSNISTE